MYNAIHVHKTHTNTHTTQPWHTTPASSPCPQLLKPHPLKAHWSRDDSEPVQDTSSIQMVPVPWPNSALVEALTAPVYPSCLHTTWVHAQKNMHMCYTVSSNKSYAIPFIVQYVHSFKYFAILFFHSPLSPNLPFPLTLCPSILSSLPFLLPPSLLPPSLLPPSLLPPSLPPSSLPPTLPPLQWHQRCPTNHRTLYPTLHCAALPHDHC